MAPGRPPPALVGRADALAVVTDAVDAVGAGGSSRVVVIEGEAGIGKSRLVAEAAAHAATRGVRVASGVADVLALARPFGALIDAFDLSVEDDDVARTRLRELLFGDLSDGGHDQRDIPYLVQEELVALLERKVAAGPLLLALDDMQWSDRATLAAVTAIARRLVDRPLVLIVATRPTPRPPELEEALRRLLDAGGEPIALTALDEAAVEAVARELVGTEPGPALRRQLDGCAGNPFFVIETLRTLLDDGAVEITGGRAELRYRSLPPTLRSSLLRRVQALSERGQEALRMAAVLGSSFAVDDLAALLQQPVPAVASAAHEAVRAGFLEDDGALLRFRHELIRESLYEDLPRAVRTALHRAAAEALAPRGPTHAIAQHLALGAEPGDVEAATWLRRAAAEAGPRDPATAVELLRRALDLQGGVGDPALRREYIDALAWAGRLEQAEAEAKTALDSVGDDPAEEVDLRLALARCRVLRGNSVGAIRHLELARMSPVLDDRSRAWIAADSATARFATYDLDRTVEQAEEAVRWGEQLDDRALQVAGLGVGCRVATMRADFEQALALGERAVDVAGDDPEALRRLPHLYLGVALYDADRSAEAMVTMREGIRLAESIGAAWARPRQHHTLVVACFYAGAWDDALAEAETGATLAAEVGTRAWLPQARSVAGTIAFHRGDLAAARQAARVARADVDAPGGDAGGLGWLVPLESLLLEADGDPDAALANLRPVYDLAVDLGVVTREQRVAPQTTRLALATGDRALAEAVTARAVARATPERPASFQAAAAWCEGLLGRDADRLVAAVELYRDVSPIDAVLTARDAAEVLDARGRRDDARPLLEEALLWCSKLGADRHGRAVSEVLDGWTGARASTPAYRDRAVTGWEALTPAETRVAELVGEGLSNGEIAERLFISRRTVESHVARVYQKLQIKGRVALAIEVGSRS